MRSLLLSVLAAGPILLGVMAHDATGGNALVGWVVFLAAAPIAGHILKATGLSR